MLKSALLASFAAIAASALINYFSPCFFKYWYCCLIFCLALFSISKISVRAAIKKPDFAQFLLAFIVIKTLLALGTIVLIKVIFKNEALAPALHFLTQYILFNGFEIRYLTMLFKKSNS